MPQTVVPRYLDEAKLAALLAKLFPGQPYAREVGHQSGFAGAVGMFAVGICPGARD